MPTSPPRRSLLAVLAISGLLFPDTVRSGDEAPWHLQPVARPDLPSATSDALAPSSNPVDRFIASELEGAEIPANGEADRKTIIRRLTFDLTGLPPSPEEVDAFVADSRPDAYERLVDQLLASPNYGQRWGRHWLDVVRFAETHGYERDDPKPNAWRYRDYVIAAWNHDKPYDRFLTEQIAGDELSGDSPDARIATGMHRLGLIDDEPADPVMDRYDQLDDMIKTVGTTFLGLSIHCARCHDHKFDPISQVDYYRMLSFFEPTKPYVRDSVESISLPLSSESEQKRLAEIRQGIDRSLAALRQQKEATPEANALARQALDRRIQALEQARPADPPLTLGLTDAAARPEPTHVRVRGDAHKKGAEVAPAFLSAIALQMPVPSEGTDGTTGRRSVLARWLTDPANPLTARVLVNRLWHYHFGRGVVSTPSDFGAMGEQATHPELIDWLAAELVEREWSVKAIQRLIVTSAAYRRASTWNADAAEADPENTLLWRFTPRRLEAEPIRDAVLLVAGSLNHAAGGPSIMPPIDAAVLAGQSRPGNGWDPSPPREAARRSVYVKMKRTLPLPELEVLDAADMNDTCPRRPVTTTAPQALTLINSAFMHEQARAFADRLRAEAAADQRSRVDLAFRLAYGRSASDDESREAVEFLRRQALLIGQRANPGDRQEADAEALRAFCLVVLNSNEFLNVD